MMCVHMNWKASIVCNFNCLIETTGLFKVTAWQSLPCKCGSISETVQYRDLITAVVGSDRLWSEPWVNFKVIHLLDAITSAIFCTIVQQLTRFQLIQHVAGILCDSWASCSLQAPPTRSSDVHRLAQDVLSKHRREQKCT